jgi:hypothetical protein
MVSVLVSSAVDRGCESQSGHTKDCKIGICCFSAKHEKKERLVDSCVPDWQYNAADSGSNASVSCAPGIPALFQKQQNIYKIIKQKNILLDCGGILCVMNTDFSYA